MTSLDAVVLDRASGALLGTAVGDSLGAGYEFGAAEVEPPGPAMIGGGLGGFAPGEWTDDTAMMWCIAEVAATDVDLRSETGLNAVAQRFRDWYETQPPDIGMQTRRVLLAGGPGPTGTHLAAAAEDLHRQDGRSGGNGSLMRTAPVALPYLTGEEAVNDAARKISALTHYEEDAQEACALWSLAIRHAIIDGEFNIRAGMTHLADDRADVWDARIVEAEQQDPSTFTNNAWVVHAFQAAWSAISRTPTPDGAQPCEHFAGALRAAVGAGGDTDTVAAIAGGLLGARWGASAIPAEWRRPLHGYPGISGDRLVELATLAANRGSIVYGWPLVPIVDYGEWSLGGIVVQHPHDDGVFMGDAAALHALPSEVSAVVSLCLVGSAQVPSGLEHVVFRLIDTPDPSANPNLDYVLLDAARTIKALRRDGHTVFVHCVAAHSRTPTVAAVYSMELGINLSSAIEEVCSALPDARPNAGFVEALERLSDVANTLKGVGWESDLRTNTHHGTARWSSDRTESGP